MEKDKLKRKEVTLLLGKQLVTYTKHLMEQVGHKITDEEAANLVVNIGLDMWVDRNKNERAIIGEDINPF